MSAWYRYLLSEITFLNNQTILNNLKSEPTVDYKAAETSPEVDVMSWWAEDSDTLQRRLWSATAKMFFIKCC